MSKPPPKFEQVPHRRVKSSPVRRAYSRERVDAFRNVAFSAGIGNDVGSFSSPLPSQRQLLTFRSFLGFMIPMLLTLALVIATGWSSRPQAAQAIPQRSEVHVPQSDAGEQGTPAQIVVYVSGAVNNPGVVRIASDSRVDDALKAAGGPRGDADLVQINLAQRVEDGVQVHVPKVGENAAGASASPAPVSPQSTAPSTAPPPSPPSVTAPSGDSATEALSIEKISINSASQAELESIPGVGPVMAQRIIDWRTQNGAFRSVEELANVSGIGEKTLARLAAYVKL